MQAVVPFAKFEPGTGPLNVSDVKTDLTPGPSGVDNRLRAVFGKIAPQLLPLLNTHEKTCFEFLQKACIADDTNDRAAYLNVISEMWDMIQNYRQQNKKLPKRRGRRRLTKGNSTDATPAALPVQQPSFDGPYNFTEEDLLWIVKYAEFGSLITQLTKCEDAGGCFLYLHCAKVADDAKYEVHYDRPLRAMRAKVERFKQGLPPAFLMR